MAVNGATLVQIPTDMRFSLHLHRHGVSMLPILDSMRYKQRSE